jgi:alkylation response protein AidB-like acyl-CoA dehydrogenase
MDLRFSTEENAFRQELRDFFRSAIPSAIRTKVMENRHLDKDELVTSHKILHAKGLTVPHWPQEWGGANWTPMQQYIYT